MLHPLSCKADYRSDLVLVCWSFDTFGHFPFCHIKIPVQKFQHGASAGILATLFKVGLQASTNLPTCNFSNLK
jgi:hypothetical protein